ncbi:MAG: UDP-3-O-(3-hydroxymyristoyl)glucosamine N-acyltransferase [Calditrichaeota bacterium]|nr:UDP-3-O-(3-hydroxymyristoyl)glucosamine N-acyltransferase [Calditrichota bacterium]
MTTIKDILAQIPFIKFVGNKNQQIINIVAIDEINNEENAISWCRKSNSSKLENLNKGTIIVDTQEFEVQENCNYIIVENARRTFQIVLELFFKEAPRAGIAASAKIDKNVKIGKNVYIGENVVIESGCIIGDHVEILHNTTIMSTKIGNNVKIGANNTIGNIGFGYEQDEHGKYQQIIHLGNVVIDDNVEIGNNTCIDRAVLGSTYISENVKIDNLVHIAHGVFIGKNSLIIANSMIAGSSKIGENVWVAPSVSILNQKIIEQNAIIGMGAVVIRDVQENQVVVGNPARELKK